MEVWTARLDRFPNKEAAYFARDEEMIRSADRVIAFWDGCSCRRAPVANALIARQEKGVVSDLARLEDELA
jgi:hypothetical protein